MSRISSQPLQIPGEIFDNIITCLIPPPPFNPVALPSDDILTKTLLSLAQACRATYPSALKYLYKYCVYIDSLEKVYQLVRTLSSRKERGEEKIHPITSMYLTILSEDSLLPHERGPWWRKSSKGNLCEADLKAVTSLLNLLSPTLTRLILQMPSALTKSHSDLMDGDGTWSALGFLPFTFGKLSAIDLEYFTAFQSLVHLEVLVNLRDNFDGLSSTQFIWLFFPKLRVLGMFDMPEYMYGTDHRKYDIAFREWSSMKGLETVIVMEGGLARHEEDAFEVVRRQEGQDERVFNMVTVAWTSEALREAEFDTWRWNGRMRFRDVGIDKEDGKDSPLNWMRSRLLRGEDCLST